MALQTKIGQAAQKLAEQYESNTKYVLEGELLPSDLDEAYAVQEQYQEIIAKLAYTTEALQQATGIDAPCAGTILAKNVRHSPATLASSDFLQVGIECEVAARLGSDLPASGAPYDRAKVAEAVDALMAAFEVVDNRRTDGQEKQVQLLTGVASNILNAGVVLGAPVTDWRGIDLAASYGSMTINGELVGDGHGSDVMGHPLEPLVWLANKRSREGKGLAAGLIVITGSIVSPKWLKPGDSATISIEGLGSAELKVS